MDSNQHKEPVLVFAGVSKVFPTRPGAPLIRALDNISFHVDVGEIVGLVGPNGSGKTTAFRLAAGLVRFKEGRILVAGAAPGSLKAGRTIGYMPELPGLPPALTPLELLDFVGRIFSMGAKARRDRIEALAQLLSMGSFLKKRISRLSKGMAKKTSLAAALFNEPRLLLLDEPLEGLDPLSTAAVKKHLAAQAKGGVSILISSHILSDIETLCEKILLLNRGSILVQGDCDVILAARELMEIRYACDDSGEDLAEALKELIEGRGGKVLFSGHPKEGLETLFTRIVGTEPEERP